ncbi:MAG TPA: outer membrane beta-barrel protein [Vicinamibacterales bacterium]|nr:outer membrane beta-barrel protein [Vicinamibacterales bacterium]
MRAFVLAALVSTAAAPAAAQSAPPVGVRGFFAFTEQAFSAKNTFNAVFGKSSGEFLGGGVQVIVLDSFFGEVSGSRLEETGSRVVVANGDVVSLGIPLKATLTPIELTGGYRFRLRNLDWLRPYADAGVGWYSYKEACTAAAPTCSAIDADLSAKHNGFVMHGGVELRLHGWVGVSADVQYTHVPGIIGSDGASKAFNEQNLGGVGGRFRVIVGR